MRLIYIVGCCLFTCMVFAQSTINRIEYFFDTDPGLGNGTAVSFTSSSVVDERSFNVNINSLSIGFHNLHIRSRNSSGLWSLTAIQTIFKQATPVAAANLAQVEYFINNDPGNGKATQLPIGAGENDVSVSFDAAIDSLPPGFHALQIRSRNATGKWSLNAAQIIYKQAIRAVAPKLVQAEYFFNQDPGMGNGKPIALPAGQMTAAIDVNAIIDTLPDGFHQLYARSRDENGVWSLTAMQAFYKQAMPDSIAPLLSRMEYFIGSDPGYGNATPIVFNANNDFPSFLFAANIAGLTNGNHLVQVRSMDTLGRWSLNAIDTISISTPTSSQAIVINSLLIPPAQDSVSLGEAPISMMKGENILQDNVATNSVGLTLCAGKTIKLAFDPKGSFSQDNIFTVQLSNRNGSFSNPINIGTINSTSGSIVTLQLPRHLSSGTNYRLRVNSNMPALTGDPLDSALTINDIYVGADSTILHDCLNQTTNLRNVYKTSGLTTVWNTPTPTAAPPGEYRLIVNNSTNCPDTAFATITLQTATWTGTVSTDWHTPANWSTGKVPTDKTHVIILAGTPNGCTISNADALAASVHAKPGAAIQTSNGRSLTINGKCATLPVP